MLKKETSYLVKRTRTGLGLVATRSFRRGDYIIDYTGDIISPDEADVRANRYLFDIDEKHTIDGSTRANTARYINHACRPNCEAESDSDELRIRIFAKRHISAGEELTLDYGKEYVDTFITPSGCRCDTCRRENKGT